MADRRLLGKRRGTISFKPLWSDQLKELIPTLLIVNITIFLTLCVFLIIRLRYGVPMPHLFRDPVEVMKAPLYLGVAQKIGFVLWCFSAAICLFSFVVLRNDLHNREWSYFFLCSGLITSVLLIDDYFLMHEFLTRYSQIAEKVILSLYGIIVALYLIRFSKTLLNTEYLLLLIAFGFFGFSIMIDLELVYFPGGTFAEDGTKLFGIANWCAYHTRACLKQIKLSTIVSAHLGQ